MHTFKQFLVEEGPVISPAPLSRLRRPPLATGGSDRARTMLNSALNNSDRGVKRLMAVQDGKVIGAISYYGDSKKKWVIDRMGSLQKGTGTLLLQRVIEAAKKAGVERLELWSTETSDTFYTRFGFKHTGDASVGKGHQVLLLQPESRGI
jgi:hypothetical protein